ncbi:hypothetical protein TSAR_016805 [Trichomalopsis sarcophagae]|uniref:Uncharacterized protein n=1 Tax=Trichomalopsis sarcophagae TaxID=543379 RepID=A0A232EDQ8_9HYME|nr:hypothetical protein TSAR_016805 [Trichomalopsis sarcophagae]
MCREVVNVEEMYAPNFDKLKINYSSNFMCLNHGIQGINSSCDCALNHAYRVRSKDVRRFGSEASRGLGYCNQTCTSKMYVK